MSWYSENIIVTDKTRNLIEAVKDYKWLWTAGAAQCGKSVDVATVSALIIEDLPQGDDLIIAAGYSSASVQNNVGHCSGLGLEHYFEGRCKKGDYKGLPALFIQTDTGPKTLVYTGGNTKVQNNKIHGFSASLVIIDELDRIHPNMLEELKQRVQARPNAKFVVTHNPPTPKHQIYDILKSLQINDQVYYEHYTLWDNPILTDSQIAEIIKGEDTTSQYYRKYILGESVNVEGKLFNFTNINKLKGEVEWSKYGRFATCLDLGESISATAMLTASPYYNKDQNQWELHILPNEYHHMNNKVHEMQKKQPYNYAEDYVEYIKDKNSKFNRLPDKVLFDATDSWWRDLTKILRQQELGNIIPKRVTKDKEEEVIHRIQSWLYQGKLKIHEQCEQTIIDIINSEYDMDKYERSGIISIKEEFDETGHGDLTKALVYLSNYYKNIIK